MGETFCFEKERKASYPTLGRIVTHISKAHNWHGSDRGSWIFLEADQMCFIF